MKSGKKWQICLYTLGRISKCLHLSILKPCLESFPDNYDQYLKDRISCISFKKEYVNNNGVDAGKLLPNKTVINSLGENIYITSKYTLQKKTEIISKLLQNKDVLKKFYNEAIFNNDEVDFLTIKDTHYKKDGLFKVFVKDDVLDILTELTFPAVSKAITTSKDFSVAGQKILLRYKKHDGTPKNIVEIEVRNESETLKNLMLLEPAQEILELRM